MEIENPSVCDYLIILIEFTLSCIGQFSVGHDWPIRSIGEDLCIEVKHKRRLSYISYWLRGRFSSINELLV